MHDEEWQLYKSNGEAITNGGAKASQFKKDKKLIMSNSHVWLWQKVDNHIQIMLQKRSANISRFPGWYHISASGHINKDETPVEAAIRETKEELGIDINPEKLFYIYSCRLLPNDPNNIVNVYLYELNNNQKIKLEDGEVESVEWINIKDFKNMIKDPEANNIIPESSERFSILIKAIEYLA
jgi:8-oxo-dGTP pyrophosphatase MutT (NUDIX family)